jgi:hypothetical protein
MTSEEGKGGLPTWAKVLIGLVIVVILGVGGLVVGGIVFFQNASKQWTDPVAIAKVSQSIADFPEPLPEGYKYLMGMDLAGIKTVTVEHADDKQTIIIMSFPKKDKTDAQTMVNELFEKGVKTQQTQAKFEDVKSKGTETVAGLSMPYIIGTMTDNTGNKAEGMVGCIVSETKSETIFIYGMQPQGAPYNLQATLQLLKSIKGI